MMILTSLFHKVLYSSSISDVSRVPFHTTESPHEKVLRDSEFSKDFPDGLSSSLNSGSNTISASFNLQSVLPEPFFL
jgi:hypothetical protein